jgi:hypothetical protein
MLPSRTSRKGHPSLQTCWLQELRLSADNLPPLVVAALIELGFVTLSTARIPLLTEAGQKAYVVMESGDGEVPELDNYGREQPPEVE